jgi:hypothetical protein
MKGRMPNELKMSAPTLIDNVPQVEANAPQPTLEPRSQATVNSIRLTKGYYRPQWSGEPSLIGQPGWIQVAPENLYPTVDEVCAIKTLCQNGVLPWLFYSVYQGHFGSGWRRVRHRNRKKLKPPVGRVGLNSRGWPVALVSVIVESHKGWSDKTKEALIALLYYEENPADIITRLGVRRRSLRDNARQVIKEIKAEDIPAFIAREEQKERDRAASEARKAAQKEAKRKAWEKAFGPRIRVLKKQS